MHAASALLAAAVAAPAVALASRGDSSSWKPAQETDSVDKGANNVQGWSPRTTDGPKPLFGRMDLAKRLEGYTLGPATCGFVSTDNDVIGCQSAGLTCAYQNGYAGCCVPNKSCSAVKTRCVDYSESLSGACSGLTDAHTVCCGTRSMGSCYTWEVNIGSAEGRSSGVYTVFDCSATAGIGKLLDYDPAWARTHSFPSTTSSAPSPTETDDFSDGSDSNSDDEDSSGGKKKSNVGAIAGGAVGGVAALALLGTAIFFCMRRKKKDGKSSQDASPPAPMSQQPYSPASPATTYPSGAPSQYGYPPQPYSPGSNNYNPQQQPYSPGYQQQYAQQQQWGQGPYDPTSPSAVSPGTHTSQTPPAFHTSSSPVGDHSKSPPPQNVSELGAVNPVGADTNRAELG